MIDISLSISPITGPAQRVIGTSTVARDIRSRKKAEAELTRLNDEIQLQRLRVFRATIRTVQDIVNNLLNSFQLIRIEAEAHTAPRDADTGRSDDPGSCRETEDARRSRDGQREGNGCRHWVLIILAPRLETGSARGLPLWGHPGPCGFKSRGN